MSGKRGRLHGLLTAILTPFDMAGILALELIPALLDFQRTAGIDGVVVCGTNGEGTSLSVDERKQVLEIVMQYSGHLQVVAGTGATCLTDALELTRHAASLRVDAILLLPPFFYKQPPTAGLIDYFLPILDSVDLPMLLYNIPQMTSVPITDDLLNALADHPRLAGVKDSAGDWTRTKQLIDNHPQLKIFGGSDFDALRCWRGGAAGCISGGANPFPEIVAAVRDAVRSGDPVHADAAQDRLNSMLDILVSFPSVGASKSVLARRGFPKMGVRPSLVNLTEIQEAAMLAEFADAQMLT